MSNAEPEAEFPMHLAIGTGEHTVTVYLNPTKQAVCFGARKVDSGFVKKLKEEGFDRFEIVTGISGPEAAIMVNNLWSVFKAAGFRFYERSSKTYQEDFRHRIPNE